MWSPLLSRLRTYAGTSSALFHGGTVNCFYSSTFIPRLSITLSRHSIATMKSFSLLVPLLAATSSNALITPRDVDLDKRFSSTKPGYTTTLIDDFTGAVSSLLSSSNWIINLAHPTLAALPTGATTSSKPTPTTTETCK